MDERSMDELLYKDNCMNAWMIGPMIGRMQETTTYKEEKCSHSFRKGPRDGWILALPLTISSIICLTNDTTIAILRYSLPNHP